MSIFTTIIENMPEVAAPTQRRLSFKEKLKWTLLILVLFFVLSLVPLFGLGANALQQFEFLRLKFDPAAATTHLAGQQIHL